MDYSQFIIPQASTKISSDAGIYNANLPIQPFRLFTNQQSASHVSGPAGNAGDNNDFTFKFDRDNRDIVLKKLDGGAIGIGEVEKLYSAPDGNGIEVMVKTGAGPTEDVVAKYNLIPQGWDLSSNDWSNLKIPAGILPIDPNTGRFILQKPEFDKIDPTKKGSFGAEYMGTYVDVVDKYAYFTEGPSFIILDISNPANPIELRRVGYKEDVRSVKVVGQYAYVLSNSSITIFNISDPEKRAPKFLGEYLISAPGQGRMLEIVGDYAYVATNESGVQIIRIKDPQQTKLVGSYDTPGQSRYLRVVGDYVYVADLDAGLQILKIDKSNPDGPRLISVGSFKTAGPAKTVEVLGKYAYVGTDTAGLQIVNISDPAHPAAGGIQPLKTNKAFGLQIIGNYAFLADWDAGLKVIDISAPEHPSFVGDPIPTNGNAFLVRMSGDYLYVVNWDKSGLQILHPIFNFKPIDGNVQVSYNY